MIARVLVAFALCCAFVFSPRTASAVNVKIQQGISTEVAAVGEAVTITLELSLDEVVAVSSPDLTVPPGFKSSRASTSESRDGFRKIVKYRAQWVLVGTKPGTYEIDPPTVKVGGTKVNADDKMKVRITGGVTGGSFFAPSTPFDLDDPFFLFDTKRKTFFTARSLELPAELADGAFLYLHADTTEAVVGEQVTLSTWLYYRLEYRQLTSLEEPPLSAFTRQPLTSVEEANSRKGIRTTVGGRPYAARLLTEFAVFPVRAGKLNTGTTAAKLRLFQGRKLVTRRITSNDVEIRVTRTPSADRPVGFKSGTVGRFKVHADVAPRETKVGDTVSVTVEVMGVGWMPTELRLPSRVGVEWLKPQRRHATTVFPGNNVGGWRTFDYAVRLTKEGTVELGRIELPYWDPDKQRYHVATAELGKITVAVNPDASALDTSPLSGSGSPERDPFEGLAGPRAALSAFVPPHRGGLDPMTLWFWVLLPPIGVAAGSGVLLATRAARRRRSERADDPETLARAALAEMRSVEDEKDVAAAAERALHFALEVALGMKSRGMLQTELEQKLNDELDDKTTEQVVALLEMCRTIRFDPVVDVDDGKEAARRAEALVTELLKI